MKRSFLSELKRRQIYRGGVMYVVAGWVIVQVATTVFPYFEIPTWAIRLVMVGVLLGFPVALVWLWMFESHLPDPESRLIERRQGGRAAGDNEALAKMMASDRDERRKEREEFLAALGELKSGGTQADPASQPAPGERVLEPASLHQRVPVRNGDAETSAPAPAAPRRRRPSLWLLSILALAIIVSGIWSLVAPGSIVQPGEAASALTRDYVLPGYRQVERVGVTLLDPIVHKLGLPISAQHVFTAIVVLIALLVLRDFWRQFRQLLRRRPAH
ncbi:MAG TPA: hypothetical protein VFI26_08960 [Lysobacter sp.]|nr:hypothetical protein [Lysobacter sp.]